MKRLILSLGLLVTTLAASSQVIFYVEEPLSLEGNYDFTWADPNGGWGGPDLTDPAEAIADTLVFADDGSSADSLACNGLVNGVDVSGKIAVIYRGSCEFGTKALNAENAGAVGVVIINNVPGAPIAMGAGVDGASVTIPVVMITDVDGAALRDDIINDDVVAFIGSKTGFYADDLGFYDKDILRPRHSAVPTLIAPDDTEFDVELGAWIFNYGSNNQSAATVNCNIQMGGSQVYDQTSTPATINAGDSLYVTFPTFSQASYAQGYYQVRYTIDFPGDEFQTDNVLRADFIVNDTMFAYAPIDSTTNMPITDASYRPANATNPAFQSCIVFDNANGSRLASTGLYISASGGVDDSLTGTYIQTVVYRWDDQFVDLNDAGLAFNSLVDLEYGDYTYASDLQNEHVWVPWASPVTLLDNQRYLFCVTSFDEEVFLGYNASIDYNQNFNTLLQPISPVDADGQWFAAGFGTEVVPSIGVRMTDANALGIEDEEMAEITPYPNPAVDVVKIPLQGFNGQFQLEVFDLSGRMVMSEANLNMSGVAEINVSDLESGQYICKLTKDGALFSTFKIQVNR